MEKNENWFLDTFGAWGVRMWGVISFLLMMLCILLGYKMIAGALSGFGWAALMMACWTASSLCAAVPAGAILGCLKEER